MRSVSSQNAVKGPGIPGARTGGGPLKGAAVLGSPSQGLSGIPLMAGHVFLRLKKYDISF
jgi:hypothetical protein